MTRLYPLRIPRFGSGNSAASVDHLAASQDTSRQRNDKKLRDNIVKEVRHQLLLLPYYSVFDNLLFKVDGDKVTLMGQVVRPSLKSDAENVVKEHRGRELRGQSNRGAAGFGNG